MSKYEKNCGDCVYCETRYISERGKDCLWCTNGQEFGHDHLVNGKFGCQDWYPKKLAPKKPEYTDGFCLPHCPDCNFELEICCDSCNAMAVTEDNFYPYCPNCGQAIEWGETQ
jgi:hypothetical protein